MPAGAIAQALGVPASSLSHHLSALHEAGLVTQLRDGRHLIYRPALDHMAALMAYLTDHCCQGAGCAAAPAVPARAGRRC